MNPADLGLSKLRRSKFPPALVRVELEPGPVDSGRIIRAGEQAELSSGLIAPTDVDVVVHISPEQAQPLLDQVAKAAKSSKIIETVRASIENKTTTVISFAPDGTGATFQEEIKTS
jgi:hypothetical protein